MKKKHKKTRNTAKPPTILRMHPNTPKHNTPTPPRKQRNKINEKLIRTHITYLVHNRNSSRATDASLRLLENVVLAFVEAVPPPRSSPASATTAVLIENGDSTDEKNVYLAEKTAVVAEDANKDGGGVDWKGSGGEEEEGGPDNGVIGAGGEGDGWDGERTWCAQVRGGVGWGGVGCGEGGLLCLTRNMLNCEAIEFKGSGNVLVSTAVVLIVYGIVSVFLFCVGTFFVLLDIVFCVCVCFGVCGISLRIQYDSVRRITRR